MSANLVAIQACINTNIAAFAGGLTGVILVRRNPCFPMSIRVEPMKLGGL